jgi:hypothetical protein
MLMWCTPLLYLIVALVLPAQGGGHLTEPVRTFGQGVEAMERGEWRQAMDAFGTLIDSGNASGPVYYNYGLAAAALERYGEARWALARAERYPDVREEARLHGNVLDRRLALPPPPPSRESWFWALWVMGAIAVIGGVSSTILWQRQRILIVIGSVLVAAALSLSGLEASRSQGIVVTQAASIYSDARELTQPEGSIQEGARVRILRRDGARILVASEAGPRGWVDHHRVREL